MTQHFENPPYEVKLVRVGQLIAPVDNSLVPYQRNQGRNGKAGAGLKARIKKYGEYDPRVLRHREVSEREDGTLACMDGNGSNHWLFQMFGYHYLVPCKVYQGLTLREEAELFLSFQRTKQVSRAEEWIAGRLAAGEMYLVIGEETEAAGFQIGTGRRPDVLGLSGAEYAYKMGGRSRLRTLFHYLNTNFKDDPKRTNSGFLMALVDIVGNEDLDRKALSMVLQSVSVEKMVENRSGGAAKTTAFNNIMYLYRAWLEDETS